MSQKSFDEQIVAGVAEEIRRLRKLQGMSVQKVADRTAEVGNPISRSTIADMELGRRKFVTAGELMTIAYVLNVPPAALMFPGPYQDDSTVEMLPGVNATHTYAVQWWGGHLDGPPGDSTEEQRNAFRDNTSALKNAFQVWNLNAEINVLAGRINGAEAGSAEREVLVAWVVDRVRSVQRLLGVELPKSALPEPGARVWSVDTDNQLVSKPVAEGTGSRGG